MQRGITNMIPIPVLLVAILASFVLGNITGHGDATMNMLSLCEKEKVIMIQKRRIDCHVR